MEATVGDGIAPFSAAELRVVPATHVIRPSVTDRNPRCYAAFRAVEVGLADGDVVEFRFNV